MQCEHRNFKQVAYTRSVILFTQALGQGSFLSKKQKVLHQTQLKNKKDFNSLESFNCPQRKR